MFSGLFKGIEGEDEVSGHVTTLMGEYGPEPKGIVLFVPGLSGKRHSWFFFQINAVTEDYQKINRKIISGYQDYKHFYPDCISLEQPGKL